MLHRTGDVRRGHELRASCTTQKVRPVLTGLTTLRVDDTHRLCEGGMTLEARDSAG